MPRFQFARLVLVTTLLTLLKSVRQPQRIFTVAVFLLLGVTGLLQAETSPTTTIAPTSATTASDPGVRGGAVGLGPRMNLDSCAGCHAQPVTGGTSPFVNPQVAFASKADGFPNFITKDGPVRE